jgi:hypothetical protein
MVEFKRGCLLLAGIYLFMASFSPLPAANKAPQQNGNVLWKGL